MLTHSALETEISWHFQTQPISQIFQHFSEFSLTFVSNRVTYPKQRPFGTSCPIFQMRDQGSEWGEDTRSLASWRPVPRTRDSSRTSSQTPSCLPIFIPSLFLRKRIPSFLTGICLPRKKDGMARLPLQLGMTNGNESKCVGNFHGGKVPFSAISLSCTGMQIWWLELRQSSWATRRMPLLSMAEWSERGTLGPWWVYEAPHQPFRTFLIGESLLIN